jgi:ABC-type glycerol-3-phosphate transport system substrate-binding protein
MKAKLGLSVLLAVLLALPLFAGAQKEAMQPLTGKLTIWSTLTQESRAKALEKITQDYQAARPGVTTEINVIGWTGAFDKMVAAIMAGNPPDIATVGQGWPQSLAGTGGIVTLDDTIDKIGGAKIFLGTSLSVLGSFDGKAYSVPIYVTPHFIFYRKSWAAQAGMGVPKTWEDFYNAAKAVTDPAKNRYGFAIPFADIHGGKPISGFLLSNGVTIFDKDPSSPTKWKLNIEQPAAVETFEYLNKLLRDAAPKGVVSYVTSDISQLVANEVLAGRYDTPEVYTFIKEKKPAMVADVGFITVPPRKRLGSSQGWVGVVAFQKGKVGLAKNFTEFMFEGERLIDYYLSYPHAMFSAVEAHYKLQRYVDGQPPELKPLLPQAPDILKFSAGISQWNGANPWAGEIENKSILPNALNDMLTKGISAEQAVKKVADELKKLMGQ